MSIFARAETKNTELSKGDSVGPQRRPSLGVGIVMFPSGTPIPESRAVLREGLTAEWEPVPSGILISSPALGDESLGYDLPAASFEFLTSLVDRFEALELRADRLSPRDAKIRERLRSVLDFDPAGANYGTVLGR